MVVTTVERISTLTGQIHLWDATTGRDLGIVGKEGTKLLPNVVYCPQQDLLTESGFSEPFDPSIDRSRTYTLYELIAGQERGHVQIGLGEDNQSCLCFTPDGRTLAYCTNTQNKGDLKLIDVATGQARDHLNGGKYGDLAALRFSQYGP